MRAYLELRLKLTERYPLPNDWLRILNDAHITAGAIVLQGSGLTVWHNIFFLAAETKQTEALLGQIENENSTLKSLCDAYRTELASGILPSSELPGASLSDRVRMAKNGLNAINALSGELRNAFSAKERLNTISESIDVLSIYKEIHDKLQVFGYSYIGFHSLMPAVERMSTDPSQLLLIKQFVTHLRTLCQQCEQSVNRLPVTSERQERERLWLKELIDANDLLRMAPDIPAVDATDALYQIRRTLNSTPVALDKQIYLVATCLPLDPLAKGLAELLEKLPTIDSSRAQISEAYQAVRTISATVLTRVVEHRLWQQVDEQFVRIAGMVEEARELDGRAQGRLPYQFSQAWSQTLRMVEKLANYEPNAIWIPNLQARAERVSSELAREIIDYNLIIKFEDYRDIAQENFVKVDFALKDECELISEIKGQLEGVLGT